ncbi:hypothetical protein [Shewanella sp.]|uniref:hypothetical protein n=1 Tax=Shewanella sp. TaxID=50422 RepID=UPI0040476346
MSYSLTRGVTPNEIEEMFMLDTKDLTGSGLLWRKHPIYTDKDGEKAGSRRHGKQSCYWRICINRKQYNVHHIVAHLASVPRIDELRELAKRGETNILVIDHINDGRFPDYSNYPENLEVVTARENTIRGKCSMRNEKRKRNRSLLGAYLRKDTGNYQACIRYQGHSIKLGTYKTELEAHHAYLNARTRIDNGLYPKE